jgi:uncharacterized protein
MRNRLLNRHTRSRDTEGMAALKERIRTELTQSMRDRNKLRSSTLRLLLSAITTEEVAGDTARELSDDEVTSVLAREAKKRREAATAFGDAGRDELATKELAEEQVIAEFLPAPLSDGEVSQFVARTIAELGVADQGMRAMGQVMKAVQPQTKGRADGASVAAEVRRQLS